MSRFYVVQLMCAALSIAGCCHANAANVYPTDSLPQNYMFGESHAAPLPVEDEWWKSLAIPRLILLFLWGVIIIIT